jgi:hypothetical protein
LPANFLDLYSADVPLNSPLEAALVQQDMILTTNAMEDAQWEVLGLDHLARGASLRDTALIPLNAGGHALGICRLPTIPMAAQVSRRMNCTC